MAFGVPEILGLLGGGAGIFGAKKPGPSELERQQLSMIRQQQGIAGQAQNYATAARKRYTGLQPRSDAAMAAYTGNLAQDPYTDAYRAHQLGNLTAGTNDRFERAKTGAMASGARMGLSPDSTYTQGLVSNADAARAAEKSRAHLAFAQDAVGDKERRMQALYSVLRGETNAAENNSQDYLGTAMGGYGSTAGQLGNVAQYQNQRDDAWDAQQGQNTGNIASVLASLLQNVDVAGGIDSLGRNIGKAARRIKSPVRYSTAKYYDKSDEAFAMPNF